ncbi:serine-rich adhesin for platelets isoform X2 [Battus philenor]|uniref:serine-rich adhesin for platelets isoform X2 n=1 Tax=Battus philenor TaxID=42288 RepID=UPI0035D1279B
MEGSEDDAGTATNASRRPTAREKDVGQVEDICATGYQQETSEVRASCNTPAMSEDNFDGDSVPSPSTQDVNTSTEAILDMIDEIVDGPGAPKRLPLTIENVECVSKSQTSNNLDDQSQKLNIEPDAGLFSQDNVSELPIEAPKDDSRSDSIDTCAESTSRDESTKTVNLSEVCHLPLNEKKTESTSSHEPVELSSEVPPSSPNSSIPASSVVETDQSVAVRNEQICERTVKCVTSSDNQDNVVEGSVECTSSDNSLSVDRVLVVENVTRSPLRRRLVRPVPIDRRPDSTVSSTVDLQSINVLFHEQSNSECIVKDVSSSSDAVPALHANIKPDEIRNVSEVSICKAETSSPVKKIKLIRQKLLPQVCSRDKSLENELPERDQCQSTSESITNDTNCSESNIISTSKTDVENEVSNTNTSCTETVPGVASIPTAETLNECIENSQQNNEILQPSQCSSNMHLSEENIKKIPPLKLNLSATSAAESVVEISAHSEKINESSSNVSNEESELTKQVPKLTIKLSNKQSDEMKSPVPKLTIKPIKAPEEEIKVDNQEQILCVTKLNIKPIPKRPEKINDIHRKSSSSEISESECSENDESTSTSDQASASDQGPVDIVPKVTIKLGKVGTEAEGQFYTEKYVPKLTIKGIQQNEHEDQDSSSNLKVIVSQSEEKQPLEKVPKLTIKTVSKSDNQPLSPKLTIKPIKPPDTYSKELLSDQMDNQSLPKLKITTDTFTSSIEGKDSTHVPKITIKPVLKSEASKKSGSCETYEQFPIVTKLNIKPIVKPTESKDMTENMDDKVPVVSKLNIKPIIKPKDNEVDCNKEDLPKITKLNIKTLKNPEVKSSEEKDCDSKIELDENSIPVITKLNIKPIIKPVDEDVSKDETSENQSSETGNSSDENNDHIPVVTKINIKPIVRPCETEESKPCISNDSNIPIVTKLNIKPILKPEDISTLSPKKESARSDHRNSVIPIITKLNIKPVVKPEVLKINEEIEDSAIKNPPLLMKINMKAVDMGGNERIEVNTDKHEDYGEHMNNIEECLPIVTKINIKPMPEKDISNNKPADCKDQDTTEDQNLARIINSQDMDDKLFVLSAANQNCVNVNERNCNVQNTISPVDKAISTETNNKLGNLNQSKDIPVEEIVTEKSESIINMNKLDSPKPNNSSLMQMCDMANSNCEDSGNDSKTYHISECAVSNVSSKQQNLPSIQNCTLLKKLLETKNDGLSTKKDEIRIGEINCSSPTLSSKTLISDHKVNTDADYSDISHKLATASDIVNLSKDGTIDNTIKNHLMQGLSKEMKESLTKPLEINVSEKISNQSSGQDSPRIILKINKTDHGPSAKIITEDIKRPEQQIYTADNTQEDINDNENIKKNILNSRRKTPGNVNPTIQLGKRLRSSRIVENVEKSPTGKKNIVKRPSSAITSPTHNKEPELSLLETKRLKLGQILSNKALTMTSMITKTEQLSPSKKPSLEIKQEGKLVNHTVLNSENCSKNGNSKLHNILSNLQAKQNQVKPFNDLCHSDKNPNVTHELESSTSTGSCDRVDIMALGKTNSEVQELIFHDNSESRDFAIAPEEMSQDPLEVESVKPPTVVNIENFNIPTPTPPPMVSTPQPKKRGRPRKIPLSEGAKVILPTPALEERPQRSLRLSRDRPVILTKPRGRGRGRGSRRGHGASIIKSENLMEAANRFFEEQKPSPTIDPTSSRIKLPRMTEALDKMPCSTPLSSRRRNSSVGDLKLFSDASELKVVLDNTLPNLDGSFLKTPEVVEGRGRRGRGRGSRGGRGRPARSPRGRGRGRGGGRGAMYMKETMGIYGRVCGPATTTVQLFEEETCMMDDNATPAKPSHLLDEDSQSSVKSSTNESSKMKKSKFADLFDSNKVWTAADVKEYMWPPPEKPAAEHQVMMIQEQVAMFLGVKSFKRRYAELKRRTISGEERDYVLNKGIVTEALCDLGITAVDASEVLDIMLSDYPHKYEEYRSHQCRKQLIEPSEEITEEIKSEEVKVEKVDAKQEQKPAEHKPEPPKVDPEKTRQDMAAAAIASASEWNTRMNALRRPACADLQSLTLLRRRAPLPAPPPPRVRPPHGFYPLALLPGQYQHCYRVYSSEQLRYFPLNTALAAPPAVMSAESSSDSENDWLERSSSVDSDLETHPPKRKKLTKTKRISQADGPSTVKEDTQEGEVDTCRICKLRLEANRKYTHERFLVCSNCNAKLHPGCVELGPDTIRKCREYPWQCAECKTCCGCRLPADDDKMLFCDLCDRGFHIYCVGLRHVPSDCVRQTVSNLNVMDYTCGDCRRGGITSRAAAVRLAPRTIATLFMAKRRFNKYAHRQYMQSRMQGRSKASENSNDVTDDVTNDAMESCERTDRTDASDMSDGTEEVHDPLDVGDDHPPDSTD